MDTFVVSSLDDLPQAAKWVLDKAGDKKIIFLYGEMGAGKTTFVKAVCKILKINDLVSSPTFSIVQEYGTGSDTLFHLDLYRLNSLEEALNLGLEDILYSGHYCFVEWPQIIEPLVGGESLKMKIEISDNTHRKIVIL